MPFWPPSSSRRSPSSSGASTRNHVDDVPYDPTCEPWSPPVTERSAVRLFTIRVLVSSLLLALFGRLWYVQVLAGDAYAHEASVTRIHDVITTATRGMILDDWGRPYAENATGAAVAVNYRQLTQQKDHGKAVIARLAALIGEDPTQLTNSITPCTYTKIAGTKKKQATPAY